MELSTDEILSSLSLFRVERSIPMLKSHWSLIKTFSSFLYIHNFWKSLQAMTKIWFNYLQQNSLQRCCFLIKICFSWLLRVFEFSCLNVTLCLLVRYQSWNAKTRNLFSLHILRLHYSESVKYYHFNPSHPRAKQQKSTTGHWVLVEHGPTSVVIHNNQFTGLVWVKWGYNNFRDASIKPSQKHKE